MTVALKLDLSNNEIVQRALLSLGSELIDHMEAAGYEASLLLERETKENTPVGVGGAGGLRGSIGSKTVRLGEAVVESSVHTPLPYAVPVELGSKPHFPPVEPLRDWVIAKLGVGPDDASVIAFAIARKIARKGTEGQFMFTNAFNDNEGQITRIHERQAEEALRMLGGAS